MKMSYRLKNTAKLDLSRYGNPRYYIMYLQSLVHRMAACEGMGRIEKRGVLAS